MDTLPHSMREKNQNISTIKLAQSGELLKPKCVSLRGRDPTLWSSVRQNVFPQTSPHRNGV